MPTMRHACCPSVWLGQIDRQTDRRHPLRPSVLALAADLGPGTIETVLAKDDVELGLEIVL